MAERYSTCAACEKRQFNTTANRSPIILLCWLWLRQDIHE